MAAFRSRRSPGPQSPASLSPGLLALPLKSLNFLGEGEGEGGQGEGKKFKLFFARDQNFSEKFGFGARPAAPPPEQNFWEKF